MSVTLDTMWSQRRSYVALIRDLVRNEEFSEIAVINIFLQFSKKKKQLSVGGGPAGKISR